MAGLLASCRFGVVLFQPNPNVTDALPTKIMEYMAAGLPMIVSRSLRVGAGVVVEEGCGLVVDHDQPSQVAAAMHQLIADPTAAWEMGQRGLRAVAERYSWPSEADRLVQAYEHKIVKTSRSQR